MQGSSHREGSTRKSLSKSRLRTSIATAILFLVLVVFTYVGYGWLTLMRGVYVFLGALEGTLTGFYETNYISGEPAKKTETTPGQWQVSPFDFLGILPILLIVHFYGFSEFLPSLVYFLLPLIVAEAATSGLRYSKSEKKQKT